MTGRQIGYAAATVLCIVLAYRLVARSMRPPSSGPSPTPTTSASTSTSTSPAPSGSAAPCSRECGRARIYQFTLTCDEHGELACRADAAAGLVAYEAGRCDEAKAAVKRAVIAAHAHATNPALDTVQLAYAELARLGVESCEARDAGAK